MAHQAQPKKILLATDLSARCDRALDRSALLAAAWQAELVAVHALEQDHDFYANELELRLPSWRRKPDPALIAREQLREEIAHAGADVVAVAERAEPVDLIQRTAKAHGCDLIVTGIARDETLGRFGLGTTVDRLLRRSHAPLLIVKQRARWPYGNILVATDLSASSRNALRLAAGYFPESSLNIFHAYEPPMSGLTNDAGQFGDEYHQSVTAECIAFLDGAGIAAEQRRRLAVQVEYGSALQLLPQYVRDHGVELVVLGAHGRSGLLDILIGSTVKQLLTLLPCDMLVVRAPSSIVESQ
jgi:nucleotide-binding universal stress UspA family protein